MKKLLAFAAVVAVSVLSAPLVAQNPAGGAALDNAIEWAASPDAMAWAKKNPKKIFKN